MEFGLMIMVGIFVASAFAMYVCKEINFTTFLFNIIPMAVSATYLVATLSTQVFNGAVAANLGMLVVAIVMTIFTFTIIRSLNYKTAKSNANENA